MQALLYLSDNLLEVIGARNSDTGAYINDASVQVTLIYAETGVPVGGQIWPLVCAYRAGSNGDYRGTIADDINVEKGSRLKAQVYVDGGPGLAGYAEVPLKVIVKGK